MKKLLGFIMALVVATSATTVALASSLPVEETASQDKSSLWEEYTEMHEAEIADAMEYAYRDLDSASEDEQALILEARNTIIYSVSWVADGYEMEIIDADGTVEEVPSFSELFPDWDIPTVECDEASTSPVAIENIITPLTATSTTYTYYLQNPSSSSDTSPFCPFYHTWHP